MKSFLAAFFSACLFGLGLGISGMTLPSKVIGFLDVAGDWDPSLIAVMIGGIVTHMSVYRLMKGRETPLLASRFQLPTKRDIDGKLILGAAIFGAGWGLGGFCPGPALVGLASLQSSVLVFIAGMVGGIYLYNFVNLKILSRWEH